MRLAVYEPGQALDMLGRGLVLPGAGGGAPVASFPQVEEVALTASDTQATNHVVNHPAAITGAADEMLIGFFVSGGGDVWQSFEGFTVLELSTLHSLSVAVAWRDTDGTEGETFLANLDGDSHAVAHIYRIAGWDGETPPEAARAAGQSFNTPYTPPALDPAGWDVEKTLWLASGGFNDDGSISAYPTGFVSPSFNRNIGSGAYMLGTCRMEDEVASKDPGSFEATGSFGAWRCHTVAIRPAS